MLNVVDENGGSSVGFLHYMEPRLKVYRRRNGKSDSATISSPGK